MDSGAVMVVVVVGVVWVCVGVKLMQVVSPRLYLVVDDDGTALQQRSCDLHCLPVQVSAALLLIRDLLTVFHQCLAWSFFSLSPISFSRTHV